MTRTHGRSQRGTRLLGKVPHGRWSTLTFLAALRHDRITAPCVVDGPIDGAALRAYVDKSWCLPSSQVTSSSWTISAATKANACEVPFALPARAFFLPPYSARPEPHRAGVC